MTKDDRQKFANLDGTAAPEGGEAGEGSAAAESSEEKVFTSSEFDELMKKKLAEKHSKMEREIRAEVEASVRKQIEEEAAAKKTEAQKLKDMTELERAQHEAKKIREENERLKRERDLSEQMTVARRELSDADIVMGDELLSMFVCAEAEKTGTAIERIKELWPKAVNAEVQRQLKRQPPKADPADTAVSKAAEFAKQYTASKNGGKA